MSEPSTLPTIMLVLDWDVDEEVEGLVPVVVVVLEGEVVDCGDTPPITEEASDPFVDRGWSVPVVWVLFVVFDGEGDVVFDVEWLESVLVVLVVNADAPGDDVVDELDGAAEDVEDVEEVETDFTTGILERNHLMPNI